jgi:hypothetical protein
MERYDALEAYARAVQAELNLGLPPHKAGPALRRAIEALRAAGMQASHVERLMAQPYETNKHANRMARGKP